MDYVPGQTVAQYLQTTNGIFDDRTADDICNAYLALHTITPKGDDIYPGEKSWPVCGHIYSMDNEAGVNVTSREQFNTYMNDRLIMAHGNKKTTLSRTKVVFCYGYLSPDDEKILLDGRIGFVDIGMALWGPEFWDAFVLTIAPYSIDFLGPMLEAFEKRGLRVEPTVAQQPNELRTWHRVYRKAVARLVSPSLNAE